MRALAAVILGVLCLALPATAGAESNYRSYVSIDGSNANDCARARPCATFQQAVDATLSGGEVVALDSAEHSGVVIDKPVTIDGGGVRASILANGRDTSVVDNPAAKVVIRRLVLNGQSEFSPQFGVAGSFGISIDAARAVRIEDVRIS